MRALPRNAYKLCYESFSSTARVQSNFQRYYQNASSKTHINATKNHFHRPLEYFQAKK
jgi:hypothetical protein